MSRAVVLLLAAAALAAGGLAVCSEALGGDPAVPFSALEAFLLAVILFMGFTLPSIPIALGVIIGNLATRRSSNEKA